MFIQKKWEDIINDNNIDYIYLIGYGSLLNTVTHHTNHGTLTPVVVMGFQRLYDCSYSPEMVNERKEQFKPYSEVCKEDFSKNENQLHYGTNSGSLDVQPNLNGSFNGLLFKIERKDFESYAQREKIYDLYETEFYFVNPDNGELIQKSGDKALVLVTPPKNLDIQSPYYLYEKMCRKGAYNFGLGFGELYDRTTFFKDELTYRYIQKKFFPIGSKIKITNSIISSMRFPGETSNFIKNFNKIGTVLSYYETNIELLIDNETIFFDMGDLSLI